VKNDFSVLIALVAILLTAISQPVLAEELDEHSENSPMGQLRIDAEYIERLVLVDDSGQDYRFEDLSKPIMLPTGRYRLREAYLEGGFQSYHWSDAGLEWIKVNPDKEAILKIGPPLKQSITITRQGPVLKLAHQLKGQAGETYSMNRETPPEFAVYKGDKKIGSGKFEFG
jgi:hypothetical protein